MMKKLFLFVSLLTLSGLAQAQESFSSVEERMTGREFMETGLSKLSESELAALNAWLRAHSVATLDGPARPSAAARPSGAQSSSSTVATTTASTAPGNPADRRGLDKDDSDDIYSRIVGEFTGWDGDTVFKLENGMVWKQAQTDKFFTKAMSNPEVEIKHGMFGAWRLSVEGYNKSVKVERIE